MASPTNTEGPRLSPTTTTSSTTSSSSVNNNNNNIKKCGYLKKQKHGHTRFFVLREPSAGGLLPARLEYYDSEKKWRSKPASAAARRVIPLDCCLNIHKRADAKHKHLIALYTRDEYFAVAAENEPEQESWYRALTELMSEGKAAAAAAAGDDGGGSASSLVGFDEASYGVLAASPVSSAAAYKEVWQVNLKSKGLGQTRNLTGVYRLCLSSRTISFVKLNSEVASVSLQLMNIRRCGHSHSFFFIEVGRSAVTGPGELWMQADDSVVAQNIHETILEAMKAMKELSEFRPRSKSQSSGTNPISVPIRRHLNHLSPSQTGLTRRSRTDSMTATSPVSKFSSCRIRTASEGDGTMTRPVSVTGSPGGVHRTLLSRSNTLAARPCRTFETSSLQHSKSMSMPGVSLHSPPLVGGGGGGGGGPSASPVSLSSCPETRAAAAPPSRPSSCTASFSGSPSDAGFISCEEYGSSPAEAPRLSLTLLRSNTPESLTGSSDLSGYMVMERLNHGHHHHRWHPELEKVYRKRTYSLTTPRQQRAPAQVSSTSLDEYTLMRATYASGNLQARGIYPEDYGSVEIGSNGHHHAGDSGYMPMMPGAAPKTAGSTKEVDAYMPMSPMCVSAPKQIINPRSHPSTADSPSSTSLEDSGYMPMWCGAKMSVESVGNSNRGEHLNMSPHVDPLVSLTPPPDLHVLSPSAPPHHHHRHPFWYGSLPHAAPHSKTTDVDQYVVMSLRRQCIEEESNGCPVSPTPEDPAARPTIPGGTPCSSSTSTSTSSPSPLRASRPETGSLQVHRPRANRPTRLALESLRTLPCMSEHPPPLEPRSPGEYVNIDFSSPPHTITTTATTGGSTAPLPSPFSDYVNVDVSSPRCLVAGRGSPSKDHSSAPVPDVLGHTPSPQQQGVWGAEKEEVISTERGEEVEPAVEQQQVSLVCRVPAAPLTVVDDYAQMSFAALSAAVPAPCAPLHVEEEPLPLPLPTSPSACVQRLGLRSPSMTAEDAFLLGPAPALLDPNRGAKVIRADPQGRRRHSSETFSSTTTVTPVCPSFAHDTKRHSSASVENVSRSTRTSDGSDEEFGGGGSGGGSPMCRETSAGYQNGLNYIALNLMEGSLRGCELTGGCEGLLRFKAVCGCKGGMSGFNASMGFKESVTL
ncbi:hypothetical protein CRUP_026143 [Coryphaenoides rupestris]|nr:hypothetical protein CRUP_026143 [Coryphaenoides rupestris]